MVQGTWFGDKQQRQRETDRKRDREKERDWLTKDTVYPRSTPNLTRSTAPWAIRSRCLQPLTPPFHLKGPGLRRVHHSEPPTDASPALKLRLPRKRRHVEPGAQREGASGKQHCRVLNARNKKRVGSGLGCVHAISPSHEGGVETSDSRRTSPAPTAANCCEDRVRFVQRRRPRLNLAVCRVV